MKHNDKFHVGLWEGPRLFAMPTDEDMEYRFNEIKENGIDTMFLFAELQNEAWLERTLLTAEKCDMNLIVDTSFCWRDKEKMGDVLAKTKKSRNVIAYNIMDEPPVSFIDDLSAVCKWLKKEVPDKRVFVNLNPNYAPPSYLPDGKTRRERYRKYLEKFLEECPVDYLSLDYYPYVGDETREKDMMIGMIENLSDASFYSKKYGIPFAGFLQTSRWGSFDDNSDRTTTWHGTRIPTEEELRRIAYLHLIFGTSMLTDFLYWSRSGTRPDQRVPGVFDGIIWENGDKSPLYDVTKKIHSEVKEIYEKIKDYELIGIEVNNFSEEEKDAVGEFLKNSLYVSFENNEKSLAGVFSKDGDRQVIKVKF